MPSGTAVTGLTELLRRSGRTVECAIEGDSMGSAIPDGATVRIRCDGGVGAADGTVVALLLGGALTVHRLVHRGRSSRARGWVVTEGDANLTCDAPVRESRIVGVVEAFRASDEEWRPAARPARPATRGAIAVAARSIVCLGLECHPRMARALKGAIVLAMTPLVWFRPYPKDAVRRASVAQREP